MSLASRQCGSLCDLMSELGPLAPTRCNGWNIGDLVAHLWVREHKPASLPGIGSKRFAELTGRIQVRAPRLKGFPVLVRELRRPGWVMRPLDDIVNAVEFFVHHEDVLRANGRTQHLTDKDQAELLRTARVLAFRAQRAWGGQLILVPTVGEVIHYGRGNRPLCLVGPPLELLLFLTGREADIGTTAEPETVKEFRKAVGNLWRPEPARPSQFLHQQFPDPGGIRLAPHDLHDLTSERPHRLVLTTSDLLGHLRVRGDHVLDGRVQRAFI